MVNESNIVVGVDWYKTGRRSKGWVFVRLVNGAFDNAAIYEHFADGVAKFAGNAAVIGVDIPIGYPAPPALERAADGEARDMVRPLGSSVFPVPYPDVFRAANWEAANKLSCQLTGKGLSTQSFSLVPMIVEVQEVANRDERVHEVHPEVSFRALAGHPLQSKKRWNGHTQRRKLLAKAGIKIRNDLGPAGIAPVDDILDAAVAAWSANRIALRTAASLPNPPEYDANNRPVAIWY